jgi:3-deoxy-manno-octulosonate cytidylyltransferase (CMP-KDO synthetase)
VPPAEKLPLVVIPARLASQRLPEKPLADLEGRPLLQRVYDSVAAEWPGRILIATDSERIAKAARGFGAEVRMTSPHCRSGTERVAEAAKGERAGIVVNLQGDELFVTADMLRELTAPFRNDRKLCMSTLRSRLDSAEDFANPNVVKVVVDAGDRALYFSRSPLPYFRDSGGAMSGATPVWKHLGLYAYRTDFLMEFASWDESPLEKAERLEQLRALERGVRIQCPATKARTFGVDTPEDLQRAAALVRRRQQ